MGAPQIERSGTERFSSSCWRASKPDKDPRSFNSARSDVHRAPVSWPTSFEGQLIRPGDESSALRRPMLGMGDDVMDEYEELLRSLVTERFTRLKPLPPNGGQVEDTEHPLADMPLPTTSVTALSRARSHNDETSTTGRSDP
jgi:hypothetical protein